MKKKNGEALDAEALVDMEGRDLVRTTRMGEKQDKFLD